MANVRIKELPETQREQLDSMVKEGRDNAEVIEFFSNTYKVNLTRTQVNNLRFTLGMTGKKKQPKKQYKKRLAEAPAATVAPGGGTDGIKQLVDKLHAELDAFSAYIIKKIRIELLKRIGEARQKRIDAGEDVEPIKEGAEEV